ncbi:hypothetical protein IHQ71_18700 [Rhizobium sp. TH2]|uniref:hypothetical protein n=1 Tax=Rhizobium sp. TH2 TaxID=2775403 RepID=UPI00215851A5|nr:hypothetical protein [Rhizobium sp. TH2]UVC07236.1 hypothetical protein IHQ71_18700 [Rhizobium sp. TH2]
MATDITITSLPDADKFVAEIRMDGENLATLIEGDSTKVNVEIYTGRNGEPYRVDYHELMLALVTAHQKLVRYYDRRPD